ncbi:MAG: transposase, partial [Patescibacteria group bacterium]|nr:transposase [Patescibacteria group bacterium]
MQTRTICCKLITTSEIEEALKETSERFANACNYTLQQAVAEKTTHALKLHQLCYAQIRKQFGLSANLTVRAIRRVSAMMTKLKGKRKAPRKFLPKSIDYDARIFYFLPKEDSVSIKTVGGRFRIPMLLGAYQRKALEGKNPSATTVLNKGGSWYVHMVVEYAPKKSVAAGVMGIDLGITNIATTSTNVRISGKTRQHFKSGRLKVRASLQSKGTQGAKKALKRLSGKENRRIKHENHVLSKQLVEEAIRHDCGVIRMEQLKAIRDRTKTWNKHLNRMVAGWSFYQLQQFVKYKAAAEGISV